MKYLDKSGLTYLINLLKGLIPTKTSQLTNDSGFITSQGDNTTYTLSKNDSNEIILTGSDGSSSKVTDSNTSYVRQYYTNTSANYPLLFKYDSGITDTTSYSIKYSRFGNTIYANPNTGTITATNFSGKVNGYTISASVPSGAKFTDTTYTHPAGSGASKSTGLYKFSTDANSHISGVTAVTKADITALGIPAQDTVYTLPTASSSTLGGVKTTSSVTSTSGLTACPIISGVPYYKDTNTTYTLGSFGVNASATELNYVKGVTSAIQTQLDGKAPSSHSHSYLPLAGGTMDQKATIKWTAMNSKNPYVGYCSASSDGTFMVGSIAGTSYTTGLAIGGSSGNLLWKGAKILDANNYTEYANKYTLPTASTTLGGVKTTSNVTSTSGLTACPIINGVVYYKDTNSTYSLSSFGITATSTELNYCDGVTSNIQTQINTINTTLGDIDTLLDTILS